MKTISKAKNNIKPISVPNKCFNGCLYVYVQPNIIFIILEENNNTENYEMCVLSFFIVQTFKYKCTGYYESNNLSHLPYDAEFTGVL